MNKVEINKALKIFLGTDEYGGFQPIGCEDRLKNAYPNEYTELSKLLTPYLTIDGHFLEPSNESFNQLDLFKNVLQERFPELDDISVRALVNRYSYDNK